MADDAPTFQFNIGQNEPLRVEGWDAVELLDQDEATKRNFQEELDHCSFYRQCFSSPAGQYVLQDLADGYLKQRIVRPEQSERHDAVRQGQADVVRRILKMIEFAVTGGGRPTGQPQTEENP